MSKRRPTAHAARQITISKLIQLLIIGLLIYLILAGLSGARASYAAVLNADGQFLLLAVFSILFSFVCAATTYIFLSVRKLKLWPMLTIEIAGGLVNRLLPAGMGGLGLNVLFLKRQGYGLSEASIIVGANSALGFTGNMLLLGIAYIIAPMPLSIPKLPYSVVAIVGICVGLICIVVGLSAYVLHKKHLHLADVVRPVIKYGQLLGGRPLRSVLALLSSMLLTGLHASGLYFVLLSLHVHTSWPVALFAISIGAFAGAAVPTSGGVGGAETGIA